MNSDTLQKLVDEGLTQRQMAERLDSSQGNVKYWLTKFGIKTKACEPKQLKCKICDESNPAAFYQHKDGRLRYRCRRCDNKETIKRFRRYKQEAVAYKGGKCVKCGYNKCLGSLDFHHLDRSKKDPNWEKMRNWPVEKIKAELEKCIVVCRNCHGEIHYEEVDLGD